MSSLKQTKIKGSIDTISKTKTKIKTKTKDKKNDKNKDKNKDNSEIPLENVEENLNAFMQSHKVPIRTLSYNITHFGKSSTPHTHYLVKKEDRDLFAKLYYQYAFLDKNACCYLERPINNNYQIFPTFEGGRNNSNLLKIDIDFKFIPSKDEIIKNNPIRKYTRENMVTLITYYINLIAKYIEIPKDFRINLLEKENPIIFQSNGNYTKKDGVHIVVESYLIPNSILHTVRNEIVKNNNIIQMFKDIECSNDVDDIIDKCIISTNNWFIYGSGKPDSQTYKVTETYKVKFIHKPNYYP